MTLYRLPFDDDSDWQLWNANWDSPGGGHGAGQGYAFDFVHDANKDGVGEESQNIRAVRGSPTRLIPASGRRARATSSSSGTATDRWPRTAI